MYDPSWITIPSGSFRMGSDPADDVVPYDHETPLHRVHVDAFQLARTHVTNAQYAEFVTASGHQPPGHWLDGRMPEELAEHPVTYVDWHDARAFCQWAGVRLPTEAEWEKAARGTDARIWPWGNQPPGAQHCNFENHLTTTNPISQYPCGASPYGVLDMAGNAWEWTQSLAGVYPYDAQDGRESDAGGGARIVRGGSYIHGARDIRVADRHSFVPSTTDVYLGFRVARRNESEVTPVAFDWVHIPEGDFLMGNDTRHFHDLALPNEYPAHVVSVDAFSIAQTPVTNAEYETFVHAAHSQPPGHWIDGRMALEIEDHPVTNVSWDNAQKFCQWANGRLLTEAEWELAARGTGADMGAVYPWGNEMPKAPCANYGQDGKSRSTTPVDEYPSGASPYGVLDLAGNVWEWTSTILQDYPYHAEDGREDPMSRAHRVLKGGSFYSPSESYIRCASRSSSFPQRQRDHIGFRVAKN
jgi:formylglycine-generating enzyme required for sulfatase activity